MSGIGNVIALGIPKRKVKDKKLKPNSQKEQQEEQQGERQGEDVDASFPYNAPGTGLFI